jgi:hypothetical protein
MRTCLLLASFSLLLNLAACSTQQVYGVGQAWQRNACFKIDDAQERSRCLETADCPYGQYKLQSDCSQ